MPRFAANLSFLYPELPFLSESGRDRFTAAAEDGFAAVEALFPYAYSAQALHARLAQTGLRQVLFNAPPGDWQAGERGLAAVPGKEAAFRRSLEQALDYSRIIGNSCLHIMAGIIPAQVSPEHCREVFLSNLAWAVQQLVGEALTLCIEAINPRDMPGYFLGEPIQALAICRELNSPRLRLQYDLYHAQIVEGDLAIHLRERLPMIAHMQIAGVPERHEPDTGEVHYPYLFDLLDQLGYAGWVGCEYRPRSDTREGLGWMSRWREQSKV